MSHDLDIWRKKLQDLACESLRLLAEIHEMEKTVSRLKNETAEVYEKCDEALDK